MVRSQQRWDDDEFDAARRQVLSGWPTGAAVDLDEAVALHRSLPPAKSAARLLWTAKAQGRTLAVPRTGGALIEEHVDTLRRLQFEGGAELHATSCDSYTRNQKYGEATAAIEESRRLGRSLLNGLPVVSYGPKEVRRVVLDTELPNQFRTGTPDARLSAEVVLAGGYTSIQGGILGTTLPFTTTLPIGDAMQYWQYVERLCGYYQEHGVSIHREYYGALMGMLMPPSIMIATLVIDGLVGAFQGVKHMTLGTNNNLHVVQDVATLHVLDKLAHEYLERLGQPDVEITLLLHMWMGQFPLDESRAQSVIGLGAMTAVMAGASQVMVKTPDEAFGIPTVRSNIAGTLATRQVIRALCGQRLPRCEIYLEESEFIEREARAILDRVLEMGDGDVMRGTSAAFAAGVIDVPFSPSRHNAGKALPVRDVTGAVRFLSFGNLPFDERIKRFHERKVAERAKAQDRAAGYQMLIDDVVALRDG